MKSHILYSRSQGGHHVLDHDVIYLKVWRLPVNRTALSCMPKSENVFKQMPRKLIQRPRLAENKEHVFIGRKPKCVFWLHNFEQQIIFFKSVTIIFLRSVSNILNFKSFLYPMFYTHTPTVLRCSHLISIVVSSFTNGYNLYICHKNLSVTVDYIPDSIVLKGGCGDIQERKNCRLVPNSSSDYFHLACFISWNIFE